MEIITGYIKPELLILIPVAMIAGLGIKKAMLASPEGWLAKMLRMDTKNIKWLLLAICYAIAIAVGFITGDSLGWRAIAEAVVIYGLLHGTVCWFIATRLYDKVREQ